MTIRRTLGLSVFLLILVLAGTVAALAYSFGSIRSEIGGTLIANETMRSVYGVVWQAEQATAEDEPHKPGQWAAAVARLGDALASLNPDDESADEAAIVRRLNFNYAHVAALFGELDEPGSPDDPTRAVAYKTVRQIFLEHLGAMVVDAHRLSALSSDEVARADTRALELLAASFTVLLAVTAFIALSNRRIAGALQALHNWATTIDSQGFLAPLTLPGKDEFAALAHAVGDMSRRLTEAHQTLFWNNRALALEIEERKRAEASATESEARYRLLTEGATGTAGLDTTLEGQSALACTST